MAYPTWNNTTNYVINDLVSKSLNIYRCIQANGPSSTIVEPQVYPTWDSYWEVQIHFPENYPQYYIMSDPQTNTDMTNILTYQSLINAGDFSGAEEFLINHPTLKNMLLNANNYNALLNGVNALYEYMNDYAGTYRRFINTNINAYKDINAWNNETSYSIGNIVFQSGSVYRCIQATDSFSPVQPTVTSGWENYWQPLAQNQKQYVVSVSQPAGLNAGDIWFKDVTNE